MATAAQLHPQTLRAPKPKSRTRIGVGQGLIDAVTRPQTPAGAPAPAAGQPGGPPPKPADVVPFFTPQDLVALNDFNTRYATELSNLDFELGNLSSDTAYQKTNNDKQAKENTAQAADQMAARGLFQSSIKDASLYDIEASRSLANKFLDDKLTAATLNAGTQKNILGESKRRFDEAMNSQQVQNAAAANASLQSGWADAMAAWSQSHPAPPPVSGAPKPPRATGGSPQPATGGTMRPDQHTVTAGPSAPNRDQGVGSTGRARASHSQKPTYGMRKVPGSR